MLIHPAFIAAIFYFNPNLFPFFAPGKWSFANEAYFGWQVLFFYYFHVKNNFQTTYCESDCDHLTNELIKIPLSFTYFIHINSFLQAAFKTHYLLTSFLFMLLTDTAMYSLSPSIKTAEF